MKATQSHPTKPAAMRRTYLTETGASMIEVLVAVMLVSIGLLGIAGLSGATFNYNKVSQMRLTGMALVNDYADRARVNVYGFDLEQYSIALTTNFAGTAVTVPAGNVDLDPSISANATLIANQLAAADVDQFLRNVRNRLPQGDAVVVSRPTAASRDMDVWLLWKEPKTDTGNAVEDAKTAEFQLFNSAKGNCPNNLTSAEKLEYSCMYFKVGL